MPQTQLISVETQGDRLILTGHGLWISAQAEVLEREVDAVCAAHADAKVVSVNLSGITRMDTFGAILLERLCGAWEQEGSVPQVSSLDPRYQRLMQELERSDSRPHPQTRRSEGILERLGHEVVNTAKDGLDLLNFIGAVVSAMGRVAVRPRSFRFTSTVAQLDRVGFRAVPIILLITFLVGSIIAQQSIFHFRRFGADIFVVDMVGVLVLRELGVLIVSIMIAGRSGSAYTAELGSVRMREEVDALKVMGLDPIEVLVVPRILALIIGLPLLTFLGSMAALIGGGLVAWFYGGITPNVFIDRLKQAIDLTQFEVGMYKAPFMAAAIGLVACLEGLKVGGSAESLGQHTTASVVKAIFLVIVMDGLFAVFFASIKM